MIKKIIFDIDNTLIPWKKEYNYEINKALEKLNIPYTEEEATKISIAFEEYENAYLTFQKDKMVQFINEYTKKQYPKELVYEIIKGWESCVPEQIEPEIIEVLEYLKEKYELVILTDWYVDSQKARLEKVGILQYFQEVYGTEKTKRKPYPEAFFQAIGNNKPEKLMDFIQTLENCLGVTAEKEYYPMQPGDVYQTYADVTDLMEDFDFKPDTPIEEGLSKFVKWYKEEWSKAQEKETVLV